MTRQWSTANGPDWVMVCDELGCTTKSEVFPKRQPELELFQERGWFIAAKFGDICPACLAKGAKPTVKPYRTRPLNLPRSYSELTPEGKAKLTRAIFGPDGGEELRDGE